ncbi:MAG: NADH-quinone oxidoreductase subunit A [Gemmatimonadetes bacterium]|nr:NADH-quinone oxidoreductase subunit A [Gemmatimonadota bacterium]
MSEYVPIVALLLIGVLLGVGLLGISALLGPNRPGGSKGAPYECGLIPLTDARNRFDVKFYLVAMLFILFDIEVVFLYPWAVLYRRLGVLGFVEMLVFLSILLVGFAYVWKKGALEWEA